MIGVSRYYYRLISMLCVAAGSYTSLPAQSFRTTITTIYAAAVKDSFAIYTSVPSAPVPGQPYDVVYYCDANLKSGNKLRELVAAARPDKNLLFIGIGHTGNYHVLRRRYFILPAINGKDTVARSPQYGQVAAFYTFLEKELIPVAERNIPVTGNRMIIGHSLGGLFAIYCLFRNDGLFNRFAALSPSLWVDRYSIYRFNHIDTGLLRPSSLYLSAGSRETMNRIVKGTNQLDVFLRTKKYSALAYHYVVHRGKTHNSQVPLSLQYVVDHLLH